MVKKLTVTFGGVGLLPGMPGTYTSLVAAIIFYALWSAFGEWVRVVIAALTLVIFFVGAALWSWSREQFHSLDARQFVLDEVVGQWIVLLCIPLNGPVISYIGVGFFLFRGFDVAKPWPVSAVDRLPGKWGTLLDDVAAAVYAAIGFCVLLYASRALLG